MPLATRENMRALCLLLAITLSVPAFGLEPQAEQTIRDKTWMEFTCRTQGKFECLRAYGWHFLRKTTVVVEPGFAMLSVSGGVYGTVVLAKSLAGGVTAAGAEYVLMAASSGIKAGAVVLVGAALFTVVATLFSAGGFLVGSTGATAKSRDDQFPQACTDILKFLKEHDGLGEISKLTPEQMAILLPCLPKESGLSHLLADLGQQAMALDQAGNSSL